MAALFEEHGDEEHFFWRRDMSLPISREDLESREDAWLGSGESDEYGICSYFIDKYYSDEEKRKLWRERGDHDTMHWEPGMSRPEPIETEDAEC